MLSLLVLFAIACSLRLVYADFAIVTSIPRPTATPSFGSQEDREAWYSSIQDDYMDNIFSWISGKETRGSSYSAYMSSIDSQLSAFAATATYSIPTEAVDADKFTVFSETPAWFTALPTEIQSQKAEVPAVVSSAALESLPDSGGSKNSWAWGGAAVGAVVFAVSML